MILVQMTQDLNFNKYQSENEGIMIKPSNILHFQYKPETRNGTIIFKIPLGADKGTYEGFCLFHETREVLEKKKGTIWVHRAKKVNNKEFE